MIINKTTGKIISPRERVCQNFFSQARGLMFRKKQNLVMVFPNERKISLHMFFVFYPIDVLIVDERMKIVEIKRNLRSFTVWNSAKKGKYLIELARQGIYGEGDFIDLMCHQDKM